MSRKVLITGANGFVGSNAVRVFTKAGWHVVPIVHHSCGIKNEIVIDFCDPDFSQKLLLLPQVEAVVHLGAKVGWDGSTLDELFKPNVLATGQLASWSKDIGAYFLFSSAAIIFGTRSSQITSESELQLDTDYGYSKWLAEELIKMSGVNFGILRIGGVFGQNGPSHLGINVSINKALNNVLPVQYGNGSAKRNYIYVADLCEVIKYCVDHRIAGAHLVSGSYVNSISEMIKFICKIFLNSRDPEQVESKSSARDQIIKHSECLPAGRSFEKAIKEIASEIRTSA